MGNPGSNETMGREIGAQVTHSGGSLIPIRSLLSYALSSVLAVTGFAFLRGGAYGAAIAGGLTVAALLIVCALLMCIPCNVEVSHEGITQRPPLKIAARWLSRHYTWDMIEQIRGRRIPLVSYQRRLLVVLHRRRKFLWWKLPIKINMPQPSPGQADTWSEIERCAPPQIVAEGAFTRSPEIPSIGYRLAFMSPVIAGATVLGIVTCSFLRYGEDVLAVSCAGIVVQVLGVLLLFLIGFRRNPQLLGIVGGLVVGSMVGWHAGTDAFIYEGKPYILAGLGYGTTVLLGVAAVAVLLPGRKWLWPSSLVLVIGAACVLDAVCFHPGWVNPAWEGTGEWCHTDPWTPEGDAFFLVETEWSRADLGDLLVRPVEPFQGMRCRWYSPTGRLLASCSIPDVVIVYRVCESEAICKTRISDAKAEFWAIQRDGFARRIPHDEAIAAIATWPEPREEKSLSWNKRLALYTTEVHETCYLFYVRDTATGSRRNLAVGVAESLDLSFSWAPHEERLLIFKQLPHRTWQSSNPYAELVSGVYLFDLR